LLGVCVPTTCTNSNQCPPGWSCKDGKCVPDKCTLKDNNTCPGTLICLPVIVGGVPTTDGQCVPGDSCVLGSTDTDYKCEDGSTCKNSMHRPNGIGICVRDGCDPLNPGNSCPTGWTCEVPGVCVPPKCEQDDECPEHWECIVGPLPGPGVTQGECKLLDINVEVSLKGNLKSVAWTKGQLVMGVARVVNEGLAHLFDPKGKKIAEERLAPGGSVQGMITLGDSGRVAFTTADRIAMAGEPSTPSCLVKDIPDAHSSYHSIKYGPTLIEVPRNGTGNWRFAVPVNGDYDSGSMHGLDNWLLAYRPDEGTPNCKKNPQHGLYPGFPWTPSSPLACVGTEVRFWQQRDDQKHWPQGPMQLLSEWGWRNSDFNWIPGSFQQRESPLRFEEVTGIAADEDNLWGAVQSRSGFTLVRYNWTDSGVGFVTTGLESSSPPALDRSGNAYVVVRKTGTGNYELHRYGHDMPPNAPLYVGGPVLSLGAAKPVGSPILGERVGTYPAEVYVVTTNGMLHTFRADDLAPLGSPVDLKMGDSVNITAQPLLVGGRLWVVSDGGRVRAVPVKSKGLSRSAKWPKMHRDNCNTNSLLSDNLPSCF